MNEKQKSKLLKFLKKLGVSEEEVVNFLADYENTPDEEESEEIDVEEAPTGDEVVEEEESTEAVSDEPVEEEPQPDTPVEEEVEPVEEPTPTEPTEPEEPVVEEEVNDVVEEPTPDLPTEEPEEPQDDPRIVALESKVTELESVIEGLKAKFDATVENISKSGLVDYEEEQNIGIDESRTPANNPTTNGISDVISRLNSGRRY